MTLAELLGFVIEHARRGQVVTAQMLLESLRPRAVAVTTSGPQLHWPEWANGTGGAGDVFVELGGDVAGVRLHEDPRGWGAYADLYVTRGTLADIAPLIGEHRPVPRAPDDFHSGEKVASYLTIDERTVRVFAEHRGGLIVQLKVHFQT